MDTILKFLLPVNVFMQKEWLSIHISKFGDNKWRKSLWSALHNRMSLHLRKLIFSFH